MAPSWEQGGRSGRRVTIHLPDWSSWFAGCIRRVPSPVATSMPVVATSIIGSPTDQMSLNEAGRHASAMCNRCAERTTGWISCRVVEQQAPPHGQPLPPALEWTTRGGLRYRGTPDPATPVGISDELAAAMAFVREQDR